jgi:hypothetical protein
MTSFLEWIIETVESPDLITTGGFGELIAVIIYDS